MSAQRTEKLVEQIVASAPPGSGGGEVPVSIVPSSMAWVDRVGMYALAAVALIVLGVLFVFGDASRAQEWIPVITGFATVFGLGMNYLQGRTIKADVNSKTDKALKVTADANYARGKLETMEQLEAMLEARGFAAVAADRAHTATAEGITASVTKAVSEAAATVPLGPTPGGEPLEVTVVPNPDKPIPVEVVEKPPA